MATLNILANATDAQVLDDVSAALIMTLATNPRTSWVPFGQAMMGDEDGKFIWTERVLSERSTTFEPTNYVAADPSIAVTSTAIYRVGDQIHIEGHVDSNFRKIIFDVTAITSATVLAVTRNANGGADTGLTQASQVVHRTSAVVDNFSDITTTLRGVDEPTLENNIFQTFQVEMELGRKLQGLSRTGRMYGIQDLVAFGLEDRLFDLSQQIYNQLTRGARLSESTTLGGKFGGLGEFIVTGAAGAGTNLISGGAGALTEDMINDLYEQMVDRGMSEAPKMLLMSPKNARVLSAARNLLVTPNEFQATGPFGGNVQTFYSEVPGFGSAQILMDPNLENQTVYLVDTTALRFIPKADPAFGLGDIVDATLPGQVGNRWFIRSTLSLQIDAATRRHGAIVNLAA